LRRPVAVLGGIALVGAALRFSTLDVQSFWLDEAFTVTLVKDDLGGMLDGVADTESTPPLYYLLAWLWSKLFGAGEVGLRSLSALLGTLTIPVAYAAAARLVSERAGLVAAALVAVNPFLVWYSQEARSYPLFVLLGALSFLFFVRAREDPSPRSLGLWGTASAAMLATHYFGAFLVAAEAVGLLARFPDRRRAIGAACLPWIVTGAALLPLALEQGERLGRHLGAIDDAPLANRARDLPKHFLNGPLGTPLDIAAAATAALAVAGLVLLLARGDDRERRGALTAAAVGAAVVLAPFCLAVAGTDYFFDRNVIVALIPFLIVAAAGFGARRAAGIGLPMAAALAALLTAFVINVSADPELRREDWRQVAGKLEGDPRPQAVVITVLGMKPLRLYVPSLRPVATGVRVREVATIDAWRFGFKRPATPRSPAPGLTAVTRVEGPTYTLVRYAAPRPVPVTREALLAVRLGDERDDANVLLNP
jgi:mannosyltransferase